MLVFDDLRNLLTGFLSFRTRPEGIDMPHLLFHMQTDIYTCGLHLVVGLDDIRIERFPCPSKEVGGWLSLHVAVEW